MIAIKFLLSQVGGELFSFTASRHKLATHSNGSNSYNKGCMVFKLVPFFHWITTDHYRMLEISKYGDGGLFISLATLCLEAALKRFNKLFLYSLVSMVVTPACFLHNTQWLLAYTQYNSNIMTAWMLEKPSWTTCLHKQQWSSPQPNKPTPRQQGN